MEIKVQVRRKRRKYPRPRELRSIKRDYLRALLRQNAQVRAAVLQMLGQLERYWQQEEIENFVEDAPYPGELTGILRNALRKISESIFSDKYLRGIVAGFAGRTDKAATEDVAAGVKAVTGFDVLTESRPLVELADKWTKENVALIKTLPITTFSRIEKEVKKAYREGTRADVLAQNLKTELDISDRRAALIARDQINKLRSDVRSRRHQDLGATSFLWRTVGDSKVRSEHADLEGTEWTYDEPPEDEGLPGHAVNCRCFEEPKFTD